MLFRVLIALILSLNLYSCSKDDQLYVATDKIDPYKSYKEGLDAFEKNDFFFANKTDIIWN